MDTAQRRVLLSAAGAVGGSLLASVALWVALVPIVVWSASGVWHAVVGEEADDIGEFLAGAMCVLLAMSVVFTLVAMATLALSLGVQAAVLQAAGVPDIRRTILWTFVFAIALGAITSALSSALSMVGIDIATWWSWWVSVAFAAGGAAITGGFGRWMVERSPQGTSAKRAADAE